MWRVLACVTGVIIVSTACEKTGDPVPVMTPVSAPTVIETFSGKLTAFGSSQHLFQVAARNSEIDVTLTALTTVAVDADPNANPPVTGVPAIPVTYPVRVRIGQQAITVLGLSCSELKSVVTSAGSAAQLRGQVLPGIFCVALSDPDGTLPVPVKYVITVAHG